MLPYGNICGRRLDKEFFDEPKIDEGKSSEDSIPSVFGSSSDAKDHSWRLLCDDGNEYSIFPEDFDSGDEYNELFAKRVTL